MMKVKVCMINDQDTRFEETIIANNAIYGKWNVQPLNPDSTVLEAEWFYK